MRLVQVIENSEECVLGFFGFAEKLDIIYNKDIDELVKVDEVVDRIIAAMIHELVDEFLRAHVKYHLIGLNPFHLISNGLCKMRLSQPHSSIYNKGIERVGSGFLSHRFTGTTGY